VVTWTGSGSNSDQTVGTGLSTALDFIITKARDTGGGTDQWLVYTSAVTLNQNECFLLNSSAAKTTGAASGTPTRASTAGQLKLWAGTANNQNLNASGLRYVAYCFTSISGYSKFGSYTGNGSADGPFVYTGFRPKYIMFKNSSAVSDWHIEDTSRDTYNVANKYLLAQDAGAEGTYTCCDILSNGFKLRNSSSSFNPSSQTVIFMAFAENPFKNALAR
jgi:hypothetical protein